MGCQVTGLGTSSAGRMSGRAELGPRVTHWYTSVGARCCRIEMTCTSHTHTHDGIGYLTHACSPYAACTMHKLAKLAMLTMC